jgi:hypothetical protein
MPLKQKAKGPGYEDLFERMDDMLYRMVQDYRAGRPPDWPVLPASKVHEVWLRFSRTGRVSEESLEEIFDSVRDNVVRLKIATVVGGHDAISPATLLDEHFAADEQEQFMDWLVFTEDGWRVSDYGLEPLEDAVALAFEAPSLALKLKYLDRALNVVHQRGDLSRLFIEGGRRTVMNLETVD